MDLHLLWGVDISSYFNADCRRVYKSLKSEGNCWVEKIKQAVLYLVLLNNLALKC